MTYTVVILIAAIATTVYTNGELRNSYLVTVPETIRPGMTLNIDVHLLLNHTMTTVNAQLLNSRDNVIVESNKVFSTAMFVDLISMELPSHMVSDSYRINVKGTGGIIFENSNYLNFQTKSSSILIQTDKAIYKPGQTIIYRAFSVKPDLSLIYLPMNVDIYDPKGNKIVQIKGVSDPSGVYQGSMVMSSEPILGDWKIKVTQRSESAEKIVTVAEYVLPSFEVIINLPPFGVSSEESLPIHVKATYTFGKGVEGTVSIMIKQKWYYESVGISHEGSIDGEFQYIVSVESLRQTFSYIDYQTFEILAVVTETLTGQSANATADITFYDRPEKIQFSDSLPTNFKPGLIYTGFIKVFKQDDTPLPYPSGNVTLYQSFFVKTKSDVKEEITNEVDAPVMQKMFFPFPYPEPEEEIKMPPLVLVIPVNGIVKFDINPFINVSRISLQAEYKGLYAYSSLEKFESPSNTFVQVRLLTSNPKAGQNATFEIRCTTMTRKINYLIMSKGASLTRGEFDMRLRRTRSFTLPMLHDYSPSARIVVHFVRTDGEIVADALNFNVDNFFENEVSIRFNKTTAKPGEHISLKLKADPWSDVNVLAIDKAVLLLKTGNDITPKMVEEELRSYDQKFPVFFDEPWLWRWPWPSTGMDVTTIYQDAGLKVLTDALLYQKEPIYWAFPMMMMKAEDLGAAPAAEDSMRGSSTSRIRKLFPETWLYNRVKTGADGTAVLNSTCPDTITTWVASAFAVNNQTGLGVAPSTSALNVFLKFFISLQLPYSVIRGEQVIIQANIFNYHKQDLKVKVSLQKSKGFKHIIVMKNGINNIRLVYKSNSVQKRTIIVKANDAVAVYFPIMPTELGLVDVMITASSSLANDAILKKLLVEPEGVPQSYNIAFLADLTSNHTFEKFTDITYPDKVVEGSRIIRISVLGDLMGPTINGLENLLQMSYGCGEQNMINFAPNVFVSKYLKTVGSLTPDLESKAKDFILQGYQRELTYQRQDGSFSAFGDSDPSGSTWLTAFVIKSFVQASPLIYIDPALATKAIDWLLGQANENGTFLEPGRVIHTEMQGGSSTGNVNLASYTLITLLEARHFQFSASNTNDFDVIVRRTIDFMERQLDDLHSYQPFELAIIAYALTLAGSTKTAAVLDRLDQLAIIEDGTKHWEQQIEDDPNRLIWMPPFQQANARNIETTAYVLLTYAFKNDIRNGLLVMKWLISQRNPTGGFSSTQDTVVALQAMSEFAALTYSPNFDVDILISGLKLHQEIFSHDFSVTSSNAGVLQSTNPPPDTDRIHITATGSGMVLIEIAVFFNVESDVNKRPYFELNVEVVNEVSLNDITVQACFRWIGDGEQTGMSVLEIGIPSGFGADKDTITSLETIKRVELNNRKVTIYLDMVESKPRCIDVHMNRVSLIAGSNPVPARIFDYYSPEKQITVFYQSGKLGNSNICDICLGNCGCGEINI
ncbi:hypothetical protein CHS0354_016728 [Potamilus streckersoni]|uniref:CD109 antigen n=1 Tax=Potamilus streckersoni TaxID=2493646 RepID=A0AAE0TC81_9BIVA|nr:hypothetical protein CHS0354_016728 [Potamilus streckersoni]